MIRFPLFGVSVLLFFLGASFLRAEASTPDDALWLKVKGPNIVTSPTSEGGERPFVPVGIGYCRNVIIRAADDEVMKFCKAHSLNTVRLCFYIRLFNGHKEKPIDIEEHLRTFVDPVVQAARRNGIYVILDDHEYLSSQIDELNARGKQKTVPWNEEEMQQWTDGWAKVASRYRDEPYVLGYEVMNEPHGIAPEEAREKLTRALKAIRTVDTRHIVILGNCDWSHSRTIEPTWGPVASTVDSPYNNVVFSFHDYPEDDFPWKVQKNITAFRDTHQVPVLCTEFGATPWNKSETVCREHEAGLLALFSQERVGWMIWALKTLQDSPRNSYNQFDKVGAGPPIQWDSCSYSDLWPPVAKIMASPMPTKGKTSLDAASSPSK